MTWVIPDCEKGSQKVIKAETKVSTKVYPSGITYLHELLQFARVQ